ncbi:NUDIX domain-containing protein [Gluconobacter sp. P1D12_c]|uniref:NUDIX domain-containing protein n=1 Tax=Gluconobacter sp. P1D12_c TaxID=2762614 RepID=UPI001C04E897|nr:NUDIX domain-containing protein [Gluconobacter sp. P1D12_c]
MRQRPAARLLVLDQQDRVLLFRFFHSSGALAGRSYWSTPGGSLKDGENFVQAAKRELHEETGLNAPFLSSEIGQRTFVLTLANGETVLADERFFCPSCTRDHALLFRLDAQRKERSQGPSLVV